MRYFALASDYDGTIAHHGRVSHNCIASLKRLKASGRQLLLVTGRELPELREMFPLLDLFDRVVAENGALLYRPATDEEKTLAEPPPEIFVHLLRERGVDRISVGRVIVATWTPHETKVIETIRDLGLELQVIFNKGAVMILPSGVNKATGLAAALGELELSPHNTVAVGDAENDHALFTMCECSAAVSNALPLVKQRADIQLQRDHGDGVIDLINQVLLDDLTCANHLLVRHQIEVGRLADGSSLRIMPHCHNILVTGPSASGKATFISTLLEAFVEQKYQFCAIDPSGDYAHFKDAVVLGEHDRPPTEHEAIEVLKRRSRHLVLNMVGVPLADRQHVFASFLGRLSDLRAKYGRPHWLIVDDAHQLLAHDRETPRITLPSEWNATVLIADHPERVAKAALKQVDLVIVMGSEPEKTLEKFARAIGRDTPQVEPQNNVTCDCVAWWPNTTQLATRFQRIPSRIERISHIRKYLHGDVGRDHSFYFFGRDNQFKLRAQNLAIFQQIAEGIDDDTWLFHLGRGDYSRWFQEVLHDAALSAEVAQIEEDRKGEADETRTKVLAAIHRHYHLV